jgi:hypothetical protein
MNEINELEMIKIVEHFSRKTEQVDRQIKVMRVPDYKTVYIEQFGGSGRSLILREYKVDGKSYWAGYSPRSETVFVSQSGGD